MKTLKEILNLKRLSGILFYTGIISFVIAFNFSDNRSGGWYQQFLPNIGNRNIIDITFTDSLTGYSITSTSSDTSFILKTTNGGDNWNIKYFTTGSIFKRIQFINQSTGFVGGVDFIKTTNSGENWFIVSQSLFLENMSVFNNDTAWYTDPNGLVGGVYRTINGGTSWTRQLNLGTSNPSHIYMYNERIGFIATGIGLYKTTNSGDNWFLGGGGFFGDIYFADSLTGWKNNGPGTIFQKTTDGGLNWMTYNLPPEQGNIVLSRLISFTNMVRDTIWGVGSVSNSGNALIYKSTNSGVNFGYQIIDPSINIFQFRYSSFTNKQIGWAYSSTSGIHTTSGGDTTFYTGIQQSVGVIPKDYILKQNYPNPFNPRTVIPFSLKKNAFVKLIAYDIRGIEVQRLAEGRYNAGEYEVDFMGKFSSSGVYFYKIEITTDNSNEIYRDTKRMILLK